MANEDLWNTCTCGREFATVDGFAAHKVSLHDAEPDPVENKINDDKIRAELGDIKVPSVYDVRRSVS